MGAGAPRKGRVPKTVAGLLALRAEMMACVLCVPAPTLHSAGHMSVIHCELVSMRQEGAQEASLHGPLPSAHSDLFLKS